MNIRWLLVLLVGLGITLFVLTSPVFAQSCPTSTTSCDSGPNPCCGTCVSCTYTLYNQKCPYPSTLTNCSVLQTGTCCQVTNNFGNCQYCDNTGTCYYSGCPVAPTSGPNPTSPPGGPTPTTVPPATLTAVAKQVSPSDTSCAAIRASVTGVVGTTFGFTASSANQPTPQTQAGNTPVTFANQPAGLYTLTATPPNANWVVAQPCLYKNGTLVGFGWTSFANGGDTVGWEVGYTYGTAWVQTQGGDVYASGTLRSFIPAVTPRVFNAVGAGGSPGVVTYGTSYDFDSDTLSQGSTLVSRTNWLVNATRATVNYYDLFYHRFGSPTTADYTNPVLVSQPASRATPYYVLGDMTTSGNWSVGSGQNIVFIVNGNIVVDSAVGTTVGSATPVVDGVYIVSPTGTFRTGASTAAATAKFVGRGMFIAGDL